MTSAETTSPGDEAEFAQLHKKFGENIRKALEMAKANRWAWASYYSNDASQTAQEAERLLRKYREGWEAG